MKHRFIDYVLLTAIVLTAAVFQAIGIIAIVNAVVNP